MAARDQVIARHERASAEREARRDVLTAEIPRLRRAQFAARSELTGVSWRWNSGGGSQDVVK